MTIKKVHEFICVYFQASNHTYVCVAHVLVTVDYCHSLSFPSPQPSSNKHCVVKCKICSQSYKYTLTTSSSHVLDSDKQE